MTGKRKLMFFLQHNTLNRLLLVFVFSMAIWITGTANASNPYANLVTSPFGYRVHPIYHEVIFHSGVDIGLSEGTGISALYAGVIADIGNHHDGYGNQVLLYHPQIDCYSRYAHCKVVYGKIGDKVSAGQIIGTVGATGNVTGVHLHLEFMVHSPKGYQYINPMTLWK